MLLLDKKLKTNFNSFKKLINYFNKSYKKWILLLYNLKTKFKSKVLILISQKLYIILFEYSTKIIN